MVLSKDGDVAAQDIDKEKLGARLGRASVHFRRHGAVEQGYGRQQRQAQAQGGDDAAGGGAPGRVRSPSARRRLAANAGGEFSATAASSPFGEQPPCSASSNIAPPEER